MNTIDPTVRIIGDVEIGKDNVLLPYSVLIGPLKIGDGNYIGPHVTIGTPGQDTRNPRYDCSDCRIEIGNGNIIREYTAIQKPAYRDVTKIGDRVYLMQGVHIPHDAVIDDDAVITPMVVLAGLVRVMEGASLGISSSVHQYCVIGPYSMVAMGAPVLKNVRPFSRFIPGKKPSVNQYAVEKYGFSGVADQVEAYVLKSVAPRCSRLRSLIDNYNGLAVSSGRSE